MKSILTLEDGTQVLGTTGDQDAFDYGGGVVYIEPKGRHAYWQFWRARDEGQKNYEVWTAPIPRDVLAHYSHADVNELSIVGDIDIKQLKKDSRSRNVKDRAELVHIICDALGPSAVDPDGEPDIVSPFELKARWGPVFGVLLDEVPQVDYEDYIIRPRNPEGYECGCVDGTYLGRYTRYEDCLNVIAGHIPTTHQDREPNVFHEHEPGALELVEWDRAGAKPRKPPQRRKLPVAPWRNAMRKYAAQSNKLERARREKRRGDKVLKARQRAASIAERKHRREKTRQIRKNIEEMIFK
jgi:hypothetical protein